MANPMIPRERADYSAIVDRPPLKLPGNARVVFWTIVNLEVWDIAKPMARQVLPAPTGQPMLPDVPNWSWHEYGMRVGVWRFFDLFQRLNIKPTLSINARVCEDYVRVASQAKDDGWEFMGHSYEQGPIHKEPDQAAMIARSMGILEKFTGPGAVFIHAGGDFVEFDLTAGQVIQVDTGCVVAFEDGITYGVERIGKFDAKGMKTAFFGGEGMSLATLEGDGQVILQSVNMVALARTLVHASGQASTEGTAGSLRGLLGGSTD